MRKYFFILQIILGVLSFPAGLFSQCDMHNYIGKSRAELIKSLGKPAYIDDSNKSMVMIFYKSADMNKSFVADNNGIYQAEATQTFDSEKSCKAALDKYISDMMKNGFTVDTISVTEFQSTKSGVSCDFRYSQNSLTKKYEISFSAHRREG